MTTSAYKRCARCGQEFPRTTEFFGPCRNSLQSYCKPNGCEQAYHHERYERRRERAYEEGTRKRKVPLTLERKREQGLAYYYRHRGKINEKAKQRYIDPERREKVLASQRQYNRDQPRRRAATRKKWADKNAIRRAGYSAKRRAIKAGARIESRISFVGILADFGRYCHICGEAISEAEELNFDHIVPLNCGGAHSRINLAPAHGSCNFSKQDTMPQLDERGLPWHVVGAPAAMFPRAPQESPEELAT